MIHHKFQFHIGSIKTLIGYNKVYIFIRFNSTLVQLKPRLFIYFNARDIGFNSTLVQLKHERRRQWLKMNDVSIPHWFN